MPLIDGRQLDSLSEHPHYHVGHPSAGVFGYGATARVWILCPLGHFVQGLSAGEWAGSTWQARLGDPSYVVECIGTPPDVTTPEEECPDAS
jgi:hypothetical protein